MLVLPDTKIKAMGETFPQQTLREILPTRYSTDAHLTLYEVRDEPECPRLTKGSITPVL